MCRNIVMFDSNNEEAKEFIDSLKDSTGIEWESFVKTANEGRNQKLYNLRRYSKYFLFPLKIFLTRKRYDNIVGWQEFYGLMFAFYSKLFRVKKVNPLMVMNLIYIPKKGLIGKLYFHFMKFIINSGYVDVFVCSSEKYCDYLAKFFDADRNLFVFVPFGVNDGSKLVKFDKPPTNDFVLAIGRSNRDYQFLVDVYRELGEKLIIICDEFKITDLPDNITVLRDVSGMAKYKYFYNCKYEVIPINIPNASSGDTVLLQAMSFHKPVIITTPSCLADDYVEHGVTGLEVEKDIAKFIEVAKMLRDEDYYNMIAENGNKDFVDNYSMYKYGTSISNELKKFMLKS